MIIACTPVPPLDPVATSRQEAQVGIAFYEKGMYSRAERELKKALEHYGRNEAASEGLALVYLQTERYTEAETLAQGTIKLNPGSGRAYYVLAACQYHARQYPEAMETIRKSLALLEKPADKSRVERLLDTLQTVYRETTAHRDYLRQGLLFFEQGKWTRAEREFRNALQHQPRPVKAYAYVSLIQRHRGAMEQADRLARKVVRLDSTSAIGYFIQAEYLRWTGDTLNARHLVDKARRLADPATLVLLERAAAWPLPVYRAPAPAAVDRWTVAVFSFKSADDSLAIGLACALKNTGRFTVVDQDRVAQAVNGRDVTIERAVETGKDLGCRAVVVGGNTHTSAGTTADVRIIEVETAQTLAVIHKQIDAHEALDSLAAGLVRDAVKKIK